MAGRVLVEVISSTWNRQERKKDGPMKTVKGRQPGINHPRESREATLRWKGTLTVAGAGELRDDLLRVFDKASHLSVVIESAESMDVSFIQLLCATHRAAIAGQKKITVEAPHHVRRIVERAGFGHSCLEFRDEVCLWSQEGPSG